MITLGSFEFDSHDSGAGKIEVYSERDNLFIRVTKFGPKAESRRPLEVRDKESCRTIHLSNRDLSLFTFTNE